ncbi:MAG: bifunctional riboflavin kinase / FMN adenylyltransferase RibF [Phormidesmis priestleyi Ana]|uniref:Riboflavin biosynthesis protein n=1 Tax=Phormidesmis priestleyi Ana TaxID=1666911 RepID=A0A0P8BPB6_9CYAN|nr:MAG: bifunctional riboflavin kinase / FMN adenylyltransferase RibF [Phormidesmis priestleyi Ana]
MWIISSLKAAKTPTNIALGNFDGVHLGHQRVMAQILPGQTAKLANEQAQPVEDGLHEGLNEGLNEQGKVPVTTVVTFSPHPQEYFSGVSKRLLTPVEEKSELLTKLGIAQLVMLPFDQAIAQLSPEAFVEQVLIQGLQAKRISVGSDFRFGQGRCGDADGLQAIAASYGVPVVQVPLMYEKGDRISSSRIREALQTGRLSEATQLLGRPYTLTGKVIKGQQIGRTIGFPTANLQLPTKKYLPRTGVYSVRVFGVKAEGQSLTSEPPLQRVPLKGVMNIGTRPTVEGQSLSVEVHIMDWRGDLYDQLLTVSLAEFIRPEQKFESLESLKAQIAEDCRAARRLHT